MGDRDRRLLTEPPDLRFDDRIVWITGASRGLGRALAYAFAGAGAAVLLSARSRESLETIAADITAAGGDVRVAPGSVTDEADIAAAVGIAEHSWGRLDALVNNAGISPWFKRSEQLTNDELREILDTNLVAPFACARAALELLAAGDAGAIVNVSSIHGSRAHERLLGYGASKGGLEMVTRTLAVDWAPRGVRVNSVAPGYFESEMTVGLRERPRLTESLLARVPMSRFGTIQEIAASVMFLASPMAAYVTGSTLYVDGGWAAR